MSRNERNVAVIAVVCGKQGKTVGMAPSPKGSSGYLLVILPDSLAGSALSVGHRNFGKDESDKRLIKTANPPDLQTLHCFQQLVIVALRIVHDFGVQGDGLAAVIVSRYCHN